MSSYIKPENALKKAEDLITVGQKDHALQSLHDVITSRRNRTWSKILESIMLKYIELCVDMRKEKMAKEGLHQYKLICQQINVSSLETVIKHFLSLVNAHASAAQSKANKIVIDIEDLEAEESVESMILTAVSGEDRQDRTDREIVTPWLRFLWQTYRTVLDTLRTSAKLEHLYHETARQAFDFCLQYQRKNEFRRLSEILRVHLSTIGKYQQQAVQQVPGQPPQQTNISLNNPETLQIHLVTRFDQLDVAIKLELWQEAFRSVEDIHGLMTMSQKPMKPAMMSVYFKQLSKIFWVSNNFLFHSYALYKHFNVAYSQLARDTVGDAATAVLLAALSIPLPDPPTLKASPEETFFEFDLQKEKNLRMGTLLGFSSTPKRDSLLHDLNVKGINKIVHPEVADLYALLEKNFSPLQLCKKMSAKFEFLKANPALSDYVAPLQQLTFLRLLQQLSQVYESMKIDDLRKMITFMDAHTIDKQLVSAVKRRFAGARIDHLAGAIHFSSAQQEAEQTKDQLTQLAKGLQSALDLIHPPQHAHHHAPHLVGDDSTSAAKAQTKREAYVQIITSLQDEHDRLLARKFIIEKKKEHLEMLEKKKQKEEQAELKKKAKAKEDAERKRMEEDVKRREEIRKKQLDKEKAKKEAEAAIEELGISGVIPAGAASGAAGSKAVINDPQAFVEEQIAAFQKNKKEQEKKLTGASRKLTHMERALREEERPLLEKATSAQKEEAIKHFEEQQRLSIQQQQQSHSHALSEKHRLSRMSAERQAYENKIMKIRQKIYEEKKADQDARLAKAKAEYQAERDRKNKEESDRRAKEEEARRVKEEEERAKKEAENKKREEQEQQRKKQADIVETQRRREEEIRKKREEEAEESRRKREEADKAPRGPASSAPGSYRPPGRRDDEPAAAGGSYRPPSSNRWGDDQPPRRYNDEPPRRYNDEPPRRYNDEPPRRYGDEPPRRYNDEPPRRYNDEPPRRYNDEPPRRYNDEPPRRYNDEPPRRYNDEPPRRYNDEPPRRYNDEPSRRYNDDGPGRRPEEGQAPRRYEPPTRRDDGPPARSGGDASARPGSYVPPGMRGGGRGDEGAPPSRMGASGRDGGRGGDDRDDRRGPKRDDEVDRRPQREENKQRSDPVEEKPATDNNNNNNKEETHQDGDGFTSVAKGRRRR
eukprot:TRINITY_DN1787_c0_g1_i7.p1 TRINITY_DN1787_c0_g1~~TRINITY_DN1787_c0_g1_i7.p1  ORF type:complete len:1162 (-),score=459.28 TRINITY_DN1787_c0_g1_i7:100-3585(-)